MEEIRIVGMPSIWGLPSPSPFCLKLETWLRMEKIPYTCAPLTSMPRSKTGKVPYLLLANGDTLADSNIIIETLAHARGIDITYGACPENQARAHAIQRMLEESLYFAGAWERWLHPASWPVTRKGYFGALPAGLRELFAGLVRRKMHTQLHGQGIARHNPAHIIALATRDVAALATLLGQRPFFLGEQPGVVDASAYGVLANALAYPGSSAIKAAVEQHVNLVEFCERMKNRYWNMTAPSTPAPSFNQESHRKQA